MTAPEPLLLAVPAAAALLGCSRRTLYRELDAGRLPSRKVRGRRLLARADLDAYVAKAKAPATPGRAALKHF